MNPHCSIDDLTRVGWDRQMILSEDGERHKAMRRMFARHIGTRETVSEYHDRQEAEAKRFIAAAHSSPDRLLKHVRLCVDRHVDAYHLEIGLTVPEEPYPPCFFRSHTDTA